ncbi:MAG: hypothetical protein Q9216_002900, partial [Gyalolechia sp. 2 TL-2023]
MTLPIPRIHFYEIDDQSWFPSFLREKVQACLSMLWITRFPPFQSLPPASHVVRALQSILGPSIKDYTFIDFCSGAGGPTPQFERQVNEALELESIEKYHERQEEHRPTENKRKRKEVNTSSSNDGNGHLTTTTTDTISNDNDASDPSIDFILTDLFPHIPSWRLACSKSPHLHYIPRPINACSTPPNLLSLIQQSPLSSSSSSHPIPQRKAFHLFSLAFHHFPDPLARLVLRNTLQHASGFAILELQSRTLGSIFTVLCMGPLLMGTSWYYFWGDWVHLFFTYVIPVVPFVVVFDGL